MKRILCYGDSNTWGYNPVTQDRFEKHERWTGQLSQSLGGTYDIIEEGLNGRTTVWDDPIEGYKNGRDYLIPCLESHKPLDLVIIFLGVNDLKKRFSLSAYDIAEGAGVLVQTVQKSNAGINNGAPQILLVVPPPVGKLTAFAEMFEGAEAKSQKFAEHYRRVASELGCSFFDTSTVITSSALDGIHLEQSEHVKLGQAIAVKIKEIVG
ncbi:MAG TPA: SGNH/GDSL hydrolase family protein [Anaerolineales bacterium]|nr:SGNH/GDSL hydrolase family protein [Anaerolineales bacterium]